jgi:phosphomannomutase/phosphoglucomutase
MAVLDIQENVKFCRKDLTLPDRLDRDIFRRYDVRGKIGSQLSTEVYFALGHAVACYAASLGQKKIVVGRDGRNESPEFANALIQALLGSGIDVIDIGMVPTPVLYFATYQLHTGSGLMVTGSHNPKDYNGLKIMLAGKTLAEDEILNLFTIYNKREFIVGAGNYATCNLAADYIARIVSDIKLVKPLKIVIDAGNGAGGEIAPKLFRALGADVTTLFCDVDGNFPNHHPDPTVPKNLVVLQKKVQEIGADCGLAFDGDADRVGVVANNGVIIWPDQLIMLLIKKVLSHNPGATIVYDVKCSGNLAGQIEKNGGKPLMWCTGHSVLKAKMLAENSPLAGELSGHIFFNDKRWYGFDDGLYVGARFLEFLSEQSASAAECLNALPQAFSTPELKVEVTTEQTKNILTMLRAYNFGAANVNTIDGVRVDFVDGWALVRASNTTPCLTIRFEAESEKRLEELKSLFKKLLLQVDSALTIEF